MTATAAIEAMPVGTTLGATDWIVLTQEMFSAFETLTKSNDPLHMDPAWVRRHTPFDSTIAPGLLTLSLLPYFVNQLNLVPKGYVSLNYGFDRVRWIATVPVNSEVRALFVSGGNTPRPNGDGFVMRFEVTLEVRGQTRPAMVATWLGAIVPEPESQA
jgi:acyl dehydratase